MNDVKKDEKIISIWTWVGLVLFIYGLLITGSGVYYLSNPPNVVLAELNPSLWWGAIMVVSGIVFLMIPKLTREE